MKISEPLNSSRLLIFQQNKHQFNTVFELNRLLIKKIKTVFLRNSVSDKTII
jgi:hypothetical protein